MLLAVLLMVAVVTVAVLIQSGLMSKESHRNTFNRFCVAECVDGKHNKNNYNVDQLY